MIITIHSQCPSADTHWVAVQDVAASNIEVGLLLKLAIGARPFSWRDRLEFSKVVLKHPRHRAQPTRLGRAGGHLLVPSEARCFLLASSYRLSTQQRQMGQAHFHDAVEACNVA